MVAAAYADDPPAPSKRVGVLIIGAGPTGLGAAARLEQVGVEDWVLLDASCEAGGLACTQVTHEGFLFDMGGHVIFSHFPFFDDLIEAAVGTGPEHWCEHERVSYVWIRGRWVSYPFQNNIAQLAGKEDRMECLSGLLAVKAAAASRRRREEEEEEEEEEAPKPPTTFDEWILHGMGRGIADLFMRPYNFKVWAVPTSYMQCSWLGERVATVDVDKAIANCLLEEEKRKEGGENAGAGAGADTGTGWGPNATFRFPAHGGTGAIWKKVAALLPAEKQRYNTRVVGFDLPGKKVQLSDGSTIEYKDSCISTVPLDLTLRMCGPQLSRGPALADGLTYSSTHIVGIGLRGVSPHGTKCWLYFPEDDCPFYRCTVFSRYAEANCPSADVSLPTLQLCDGSVPGDGNDASGGDARNKGPYWSLLFEISESKHFKPVNAATIVAETIQGAVNTGMVQPEDEIVSIFQHRMEHGYPTPSLGRDRVLDEALPLLEEQGGLLSRGRFGSYKYEVGNQDHSVMLGVEAVDHALFGAKEVCLHHPSLANAPGRAGRNANEEPRYSANANANATPLIVAKESEEKQAEEHHQQQH